MRRGFSLIELLIVIAIISIVITVAVRQYEKAQIFAREMAASKAIQTIQTIQTGQVMYQSKYGRYARSLRELGPPDTGPSSAAAAGLISGALASGTVGGYKFTLSAADGFAIVASPVADGSAGVKSFYMDQTGILRVNEGPEPATAASPEFAK
jgi:prepilin-type N-terminal cleavage/methylation domain-containing protein